MTEFLVLIAALLELKSRLLLPRAEDEDELDPQEAADELLARMLEYRRYSEAAKELVGILDAEQAYLYRSAPPPPGAPPRRAPGGAAGLRPRTPRGRARRPSHRAPQRRRPPYPHGVSLHRRLSVLRDMLSAKHTIDFDEAFGNEDRFTQAVTLFALLSSIAAARRAGPRGRCLVRSR